MVDASSVRLARHEAPLPNGIHRIVLDRPKARNAISRALLADLDAALDSVLSYASVLPSRAASPSGAPSSRSSDSGERQPGSSGTSRRASLARPVGAEPLRCLIIESSSPTAFCAGADLIERKSMSEEQVVAFLRELRRVFDKIGAFPVPTVAAIDGAALGGGLELALTCDFRVASLAVEKLGFPEVQLGIIPGAGGTQRAPRLIGLTKAKELIYTGRLLDAQQGFAWGLIDYLAAPNETAAARALELGNGMARSAPLALASAKEAINKGSHMELSQALEWERTCYEELLPTADRSEALAAFAEKRRPVFEGR